MCQCNACAMSLMWWVMKCDSTTVRMQTKPIGFIVMDGQSAVDHLNGEKLRNHDVCVVAESVHDMKIRVLRRNHTEKEVTSPHEIVELP